MISGVAALLLPSRRRQRFGPPDHAPEQPPLEMALCQHQKVVSGVLNQPLARLHQPLLQTGEPTQRSICARTPPNRRDRDRFPSCLVWCTAVILRLQNRISCSSPLFITPNLCPIYPTKADVSRSVAFKTRSPLVPSQTGSLQGTRIETTAAPGRGPIFGFCLPRYFRYGLGITGMCIGQIRNYKSATRRLRGS